MALDVVKADSVLLKVGPSGSEIVVGAQRGATLTINTETIETTAKQDDWASFLPGKRSWTVDCDALIVITDNGRTALETAATGGTEVEVVIEVSDETNTTTYTGKGIITSYQLSASMGDVATYSVSIQGSEDLAVSSSTGGEG